MSYAVGGDGDDVFFFNDTTGHNVIADFDNGPAAADTEHDLIDLSSFGAIDFSDLSGNTGVITITGVDDFSFDVGAAVVTHDDFIFA
ncbi:hypothetical protein [Mesorhizobium sp. B2-5-9]|uniref:hypothetical protein n=1 Tax=Mesorhizobium sp. B2-5-9 TaxID=2589921 RepID=UPI001FEFA928|nr:hypothetical protein [Mesorhizobium sp. B2-5-9]